MKNKIFFITAKPVDESWLSEKNASFFSSPQWVIRSITLMLLSLSLSLNTVLIRVETVRGQGRHHQRFVATWWGWMKNGRPFLIFFLLFRPNGRRVIAIEDKHKRHVAKWRHDLKASCVHMTEWQENILSEMKAKSCGSSMHDAIQR